MVSRALLLIALLTAGCVRSRAGEGPDPEAVRQAIETAASRVRACYRAPRVPHIARQIVTRLRVRYRIDGGPIGLPTIVGQESLTTSNRPYAGVMAQAAVSAVLRCGPMRLPPALHSGGWDDFHLTFSPKSIA